MSRRIQEQLIKLRMGQRKIQIIREELCLAWGKISMMVCCANADAMPKQLSKNYSVFFGLGRMV